MFLAVLKYKNNIMAIIITISILVVQTGCWDYSEYENMAIVNAVGIDSELGSDELVVTITTSIIGRSGTSAKSSSNSATSNFAVHSVNAYSIPEAINKLQALVSKELFFGYISIFVIGENSAQKHIADILDFIDRSPIIRDTVNLFVTSGRAIDVLSISDTNDISTNKDTSLKIYDLMYHYKRNGTIYPVSLMYFKKRLNTIGIEPVIPRIDAEVLTERDKQQNPPNQTIVNTNFGHVTIKDGHHILSGMAAFKDKKMIGYLSDSESIGFNFIMGNQVDIHEVFHVSAPKNQEKHPLSFRVFKNKSKIKINTNGDNIDVIITIDLNAQLEQMYKNADLTNINDLHELEKQLSAKVKSQVEMALAKTQKELQTDIFGFGFELLRQHNKEWHLHFKDKWDEIFPNIPVYIIVNTKITNSGKNIESDFFE